MCLILSVWNVQCALAMFSYACRCYSNRFQSEGAGRKNHLEPMMGMIEIGNRLRAHLVRAACSKPADTSNGCFFGGVLQQRGVIDLYFQYNATCCCVTNFILHLTYRVGLSMQKYEDVLCYKGKRLSASEWT